MFENLTDKLEKSFKLLKGQGKITEINVAETLKEVRRALLDADVNYKIAKDFIDPITRSLHGSRNSSFCQLVPEKTFTLTVCFP